MFYNNTCNLFISRCTGFIAVNAGLICHSDLFSDTRTKIGNQGSETSNCPTLHAVPLNCSLLLIPKSTFVVTKSEF